MRIWLVFISLNIFLNCHAQEKKIFSVNGTVGVFQDWYSLRSTPKDSVLPRRPSSLTRIQFASIFNIGRFSLPVNINITTPQTNVVTPNIPNQSVNQFLQNPLNNINFSPSYKWIQLLLGTQLPRFSELTAGDLTVFGAGFKLIPGKYRVTLFHGISQRGIEPDTANFINGIYKQQFTGLQLGYGNEEESCINLNLVRVRDDTNSIASRPPGINPREGLTTSLEGQRKWKESGWFVKGEAAASVFNRNLLSNSLDSSTEKFLFFATRSNFKPGYAGSFSAGQEKDLYSFGFKTKYLDEKFIPAAYPFTLTDIFEYTLNTSFKAWKKRLYFSGSLGQRFNNVSGNANSTSKQLIGNANLNMQFDENWSLGTSFSNYGFRNVYSITQQKVENISIDFNLSPTYSKQTENIFHLVTASYNRSRFKDYDFISNISSTNNSSMILLFYSQTYLKIPLNAAISISHFKNNSSFGDYRLSNLSFEAGYHFAKNKLNTNLKFDYSGIAFAGFSYNNNLLTTLSLKYKIRNNLLWTMQGMINLFTYGTERPGVEYTENMLRTSVLFNFDSSIRKKK